MQDIDIDNEIRRLEALKKAQEQKKMESNFSKFASEILGYGQVNIERIVVELSLQNKVKAVRFETFYYETYLTSSLPYGCSFSFNGLKFFQVGDKDERRVILWDVSKEDGSEFSFDEIKDLSVEFETNLDHWIQETEGLLYKVQAFQNNGKEKLSTVP